MKQPNEHRKECKECVFEGKGGLGNFDLHTCDMKTPQPNSEGRERAIAEVIVDLYEIRASVNRPLSLRQMQPIEDLHKYNFFNSAIAQITSKYNIGYEVIEDVIRERNHKSLLDNLTK